jgi:Flp pilus assembly protein TadD
VEQGHLQRAARVPGLAGRAGRRPDLAQALWGGGIEALDNGQFREAISALTEYLRLQPADASGYVAPGKAYLHTGDRSDALNALFKALQLNPSMSGVEELLRGLR